MGRPDMGWRVDDAAFDAVEAVYAALKREGRVPATPLVALYQDEEVERAFKKALALRIKECYDREGVGAPLIRPDTALHWIKWFSILAALPLWVFLGMKWLARPVGSPRPIQAVLRVYATDWGFRGEGTRKIDWLLDSKELHRDNTLFVIEKPVSEKYRAELAVRRYHVEDVSGPPAMLFRGMGAWIKLLVASIRAPGVFVEVAARGWLEYLRWTAFLERWRPRHYVVYNHFHYDHVFRNSRLRSAGCESWYYVHSVHDRCAFLHASPDGPLRSQIDWTYLSYDHEVHWGRRDGELYRGMRSHSRAYHTWGPLWSGHVRPEPRVAALIEKLRSARKIDAVVAVFDTSIGSGSSYAEASVREFYDTLVALLERAEWATRLLLFKPKDKPGDFHAQASAEVVASLDRLLAHPRCLSLAAEVDPVAAIAEADLTLSIAFTSSTVEALGARRRAFYFDPGGKFRESYYEQFPNLVAHDREALARLCEHWLGMPEADFQKYLDHYVAPEFGGCLDSGAVARFREALSCE